MKRLVFPLLLAFLAACSGADQATPTATIVESQTSNVRPEPSTFAPPTLSPTPTQTFTIDVTPTTAPCNPLESYCIETGHFFLDRPIAMPGTISIDRGYPYGTTEGGTRDPHHGVEFNNASGTPVLAAADGRVVVAGDDSQKIYAIYSNSYGNLIVIEHHFPGIAQTVFTLYGHLSRVEVQVGQTVESGAEIGRVGSTGAAIGSHLHFEVRLGQDDYDSNRNPVLWLKPLAEASGGGALGVLAGRAEDAQGQPIQTTALNIQYFADPNGPQSAAWPVETYTPSGHPVKADDAWNENFTLGDLQPGNYRISLMWGGRLYERWVEVFPGQLTFFVLQVDP